MNHPTAPAASWFPLCFADAAQYQAWRSVARESDERFKRTRMADYCVDCTPERQQQMLRERRCLHPETTFALDVDGMIEGRSE